MLPTIYNAVEISAESDDVDSPTGDVLFSGSFPAVFGQSLSDILVASPNGVDGGSLIAGAISEATTAKQHAGLAAGSTNLGGVLTHTEHTINILEGTEIDYNGNDRGENPSSIKLGVGHFLDLIIDDLSAGLAAPDASLRLQSEAELIRVCVTNARGFMNDLLDVQNQLLVVPDFDSAAPLLADSTRLADALLNGVDVNGNGQVEPFEGECSLKQIDTFGVLAAVVDIVSGPLT
jgi:hypothetical protein